AAGHERGRSVPLRRTIAASDRPQSAVGSAVGAPASSPTRAASILEGRVAAKLARTSSESFLRGSPCQLHLFGGVHGRLRCCTPALYCARRAVKPRGTR